MEIKRAQWLPEAPLNWGVAHCGTVYSFVRFRPQSHRTVPWQPPVVRGKMCIPEVKSLGK